MERLAREERGQALVELALALPFLVLLLLGILEGGLLLNAYLAVEHAAREAARAGAVGAGDEEIVERALAASPHLLPQKVEVIVAPPAGERVTGGVLEVTVRFAYQPLTLFQPWLGASLPLERTVRMRVE